MKLIIPGLWDIEEIGTTVHCYLWEWREGVTLIDCGLPRDGDKVLRALLDNGFPLHTVKRVIITHGDPDHMGGLAKVQEATGAEVVCHVSEETLLENPSTRPVKSPLLAAPMALMRFVPGMMPTPAKPDELVEDGQVLPEGFLVLHTPGHTPGHISLLYRKARLLIAGDALANRREKLSGPPAIFTPDMDSAQRSILRLAKLYGDDFETIVFGHGPPILGNGGKRVRALASQIYADEV